MLFPNRKEAGRQLAGKLAKYKSRKDALVLAIPRGGVVVGYEIAQELGITLDIIIIRKIGYPGNEELAIGAAGLDDYYLNEETVRQLPEDYVKKEIQRKQNEAREKYELLKGKKGRKGKPKIKNKIIILVDDGVATGATVFMGIKILKKQGAKKVIVAVPVGPPETIAKLRKAADEAICLAQPEYFMALGEFYQDFRPVEDEEVKRLLGLAERAAQCSYDYQSR